MTRRGKNNRQNGPDLFSIAVKPVEPFAPEITRAASWGAAISRAVAKVMKDATRSRAEIADWMADRLGKPVSKNVLDAYASESRETHDISVLRLLALMDATSDLRPLQWMAERFDMTVVPRKYQDAVREVELTDQLEALEAEIRSLKGRRRS